MSFDTAKGTTGWTVETIFVHFTALLIAQEAKSQQRFADQEKAVQAALAAAEKAVNKAETNAEKWRDNANEWRGAMSDRERNFAPIQRVDALEKLVDRNEGTSAGLKSGWGYMVGFAGFVAALVAIFIALKH